MAEGGGDNKEVGISAVQSDDDSEEKGGEHNDTPSPRKPRYPQRRDFREIEKETKKDWRRVIWYWYNCEVSRRLLERMKKCEAVSVVCRTPIGGSVGGSRKQRRLRWSVMWG